jgi:hypothetical protein
MAGAAAEFIVARFGGYEGLIEYLEKAVTKTVSAHPTICDINSMELLEETKVNFIASCGLFFRGLVNPFIKNYKAIIDSELTGIAKEIDKLKNNATFIGICKEDPSFDKELREKRIMIMILDALMNADNVKSGTLGSKLVAAWRKAHPEKSFGGRRKNKTRRYIKW